VAQLHWLGRTKTIPPPLSTLLGQVPARLNYEQTAWLLNCQPHDIPVLVAARILRPLGNPQPNSVKYFATTEILEASRERAFLSKMTETIGRHWQRKNSRAGKRDLPAPPLEPRTRSSA
jgi:hypothetical protein